jgi:hypothetical protein
MIQALVVLAVCAATMLLQPLVPGLFGQEHWLLNLTPVLLIYAAYRCSEPGLVVLVVAGGILHDLMMLDAVGFGPMQWGLTVFMIHSQRHWLESTSWWMIMLLSFAGSFLYFLAGYVFFLMARTTWNWNLQLGLAMVWIATLNALASPLVFMAMDAVLNRAAGGRAKRRRGEPEGWRRAYR